MPGGAGLSPPVKYFTDRFFFFFFFLGGGVLLLWTFCVFFCLVFAKPWCASVCVCLVVACFEGADLLL